MRNGTAAEVVPLDGALEALADRDAGDLDLLAFLEGLDGDLLAELDLAAVTFGFFAFGTFFAGRASAS